MVSNGDVVPRRPHPNKVNTTGAISWATNGGYESPLSEDGSGPTTPLRHTPSTPAYPPGENQQDVRGPSEMEQGLADARLASLNDLVLKAKADRGQIGIKDRIACIQWNWFTMTMVRIDHFQIDHALLTDCMLGNRWNGQRPRFQYVWLR